MFHIIRPFDNLLDTVGFHHHGIYVAHGTDDKINPLVNNNVHLDDNPGSLTGTCLWASHTGTKARNTGGR